MIAPLLAVANLDLHRGRRTLATGIHFTLDPGQYIELCGANGSGKTTLLRLLAGLGEASKHATLRFAEGVETFHFSARHAFRPELSVAAQLMFSISLFNREVRPEECQALLSRVGLSKHQRQRVGALSEGQIRRLMLAVMAGAKRQIWLIDEPLNALDTEAVALLGTLISEHLAQGGAAVVATHQPLDERLPALATHRAARVRLGRDSTLVKEACQAAPHIARAAPTQGAGLFWVLRREWALLIARPQDALWPAVFHWMVVSLFPFGLGADSALLARIGPGVFWVSALLAMLLAGQRMVAADHEHGALDQMISAGLAPSLIAAGKMCLQFIAIGLPLSLASFPLGLQYGLSGETLVLLAGSMALGLVSLSALSALFSALGLMARQAQIAVSMASLPCFVPVLIFGSAVAQSAQAGLSAEAPLMVLAALAVLSVIALPVVAARVLMLAVD